MSAEVVKHALTVNRALVLKGMKQIAATGSEIGLMLFLVTDGGGTTALTWEMDETPSEVPDVLRQAVEDCNAVAGLFIGEFESDDGERIACVHYAYPREQYAGSDWFTIEDNEMVRIHEDEVQVDDDQLTWLEEAFAN
jgi:hypothetical protein